MSASWVVSKFGGTSMANAEAMLQAAQIVCKDARVKVVVVSATSGTTNQLIDLFRASRERSPSASNLIQQLETKHLKIAYDLDCSPLCKESLISLLSELKSLCQEIPTLSATQEDAFLDQFLSLGERISSLLFTQALQNLKCPAQVFDVRKVLRTTSTFGKAEPIPASIAELCDQLLVPVLEQNTVVVTQGFIGSDQDGRTTTLGRGGSDLSAALLAEGLAAQELHIWTDVNGIFSMDPNSVPTARRIEKISFSEAAELANFGAKVLHPATLWPAIRKNIQVFIGSTFQPLGGGTWVYPALETRPLVRAIALRKNQTLITVSSLRMLNAYGFLAKIFSILAKHQISIDLVTTSEVSVSLTVDGTNLSSSGKKITQNLELIRELELYAQVEIEENLSLVAIIGNHLTSTPGVSAKAFSSLSEFNIRLICHGASNHNLCFLVKSDDAKSIAQRLHDVFLG